MTRWNDHHPTCPGGCGELADECRCTRPRPFGSMTITFDRHDNTPTPGDQPVPDLRQIDPRLDEETR